LPLLLAGLLAGGCLSRAPSLFCGPRPLLHRRAGAERHAQAAGREDGERADEIFVKVLTPEGKAVKTFASEVVLPGLEGRLGILRNHAPMLAPVDVGLIRYKRQGSWVPVVVFGGYASVRDNVVTVLASDCEAGEAIPSIEDLKKQFDGASAVLTAASGGKARMQAAREVKVASARLQAASMLAGKKMGKA